MNKSASTSQFMSSSSSAAASFSSLSAAAQSSSGVASGPAGNNANKWQHRAFELVSFVEKLPLSIECITCYNNIFILGTSSGRMLVYEVKLSGQAPHKLESSFEKSITATKKPIAQIEAVKSFDTLVALFDQQLHVFDLDRYQLQYSLARTKGALLFATSVSSDQRLMRLCVAFKRRLQFYYISSSSSSSGGGGGGGAQQQQQQQQFMELATDLDLADTPRSLEFTKDNLCVFSLRNQYYYYELPSSSAASPGATASSASGLGSKQQAEARFSMGTRPIEPLCYKLHNEYLAMGVDFNKTTLHDTRGRPFLEYPITWSSCPASVCSVGPYLLAILPATNSIEIVTIQPESTSVQLIDFAANGASSLASSAAAAASNNIFGGVGMPMPASGMASSVSANSGLYGSLGASLSSSFGSTLSNTLSGMMTMGGGGGAGGSSSSATSASAAAAAASASAAGLSGGALASSLLAASSNVSPADRLRIIKSNGNCICYVATQSNVWCLTPVTVNDQLEQCLRFQNYDLGLALIASQRQFNQVGQKIIIINFLYY